MLRTSSAGDPSDTTRSRGPDGGIVVRVRLATYVLEDCDVSGWPLRQGCEGHPVRHFRLAGDDGDDEPAIRRPHGLHGTPCPSRLPRAAHRRSAAQSRRARGTRPIRTRTRTRPLGGFSESPVPWRGCKMSSCSHRRAEHGVSQYPHNDSAPPRRHFWTHFAWRLASGSSLEVSVRTESTSLCSSAAAPPAQASAGALMHHGGAQDRAPRVRAMRAEVETIAWVGIPSDAIGETRASVGARVAPLGVTGASLGVTGAIGTTREAVVEASEAIGTARASIGTPSAPNRGTEGGNRRNDGGAGRYLWVDRQTGGVDRQTERGSRQAERGGGQSSRATCGNLRGARRTESVDLLYEGRSRRSERGSRGGSRSARHDLRHAAKSSGSARSALRGSCHNASALGGARRRASRCPDRGATLGFYRWVNVNLLPSGVLVATTTPGATSIGGRGGAATEQRGSRRGQTVPTQVHAMAEQFAYLRRGRADQQAFPHSGSMLLRSIERMAPPTLLAHTQTSGRVTVLRRVR